MNSKINYYNNSLGNLESDMSMNRSHYFDRDTKKFFGSEVKRDDVFVGHNDKGEKVYLFRENLKKAPEGGIKYKVVEYNVNKNEIKDVYAGTDVKERNKVFQKELKGDK